LRPPFSWWKLYQQEEIRRASTTCSTAHLRQSMNDFDTILIADDDQDFVLLLQTAFDCAGIHNPIQVVHDGAGVVQYLKGDGHFADRERFPWPGMVLLDLRLPRLNGFDVLRWIRSQRGLKNLPVTVFTGSGIEAEALQAKSLGADAFLVKPFQFHELMDAVEHLKETWHGGKLAA
jgi:DNA-binding response OmpR family regulator